MSGRGWGQRGIRVPLLEGYKKTILSNVVGSGVRFEKNRFFLIHYHFSRLIIFTYRVRPHEHHAVGIFQLSPPLPEILRFQGSEK